MSELALNRVIQVMRSAEPDENIRIPETLGLFTWRGHSAIIGYIGQLIAYLVFYIDQFGINISVASGAQPRPIESRTESPPHPSGSRPPVHIRRQSLRGARHRDRS